MPQTTQHRTDPGSSLHKGGRKLEDKLPPIQEDALRLKKQKTKKCRGRVELARLVDGVAVDVGEAEATRAPVGTVLALVVHGAVALALVEAHVRVVQQVAAGRGAGGHGGEAADDDDREGAAVRGPELEEAHAGARGLGCLGGHGGCWREEVVVECGGEREMCNG
ncbi:unnamed protein product [Phytophthora lilii]|uniref:Unnamed protein product n=1 Tax=Phytophthora lilii TaxID=2077276 RepID=A0A9W6TIG3_9STRA|nr:unnamed protein product [Phytophthora lilii]